MIPPLREVCRTSCRSAADGGIRHQRSSKHPDEIKPEELEIDWPHHGGDHHHPAPPPTSSRPSAGTAGCAAQKRRTDPAISRRRTPTRSDDARPGQGRLPDPAATDVQIVATLAAISPARAATCRRGPRGFQGRLPTRRRGLPPRPKPLKKDDHDQVFADARTRQWCSGAAGRSSCTTDWRSAAGRRPVRLQRRVRHRVRRRLALRRHASSPTKNTPECLDVSPNLQEAFSYRA